MRPLTLVRTLALAACLLCLGVVVLGAYVRLSNAGLGCPDWPGCYGHFTPAGAAADAPATAAAYLGRPLQVGKAWREMVHRYAAGTLGFLIVCLVAMGLTWRRERVLPVGYVVGLLGIVVLQGALGMLTVTWQLKPLIVTLHLLFGLTTLSLLWWLTLTLWRRPDHAWVAAGTHSPAPAQLETRPGAPPFAVRPAARPRSGRRAAARGLALTGLIVLAAQIALGGWTSSNYAALACPDVPTCQGAWWPRADFHSGFVLWQPLSNTDYEGGLLASAARVAIQLTHRMGAVLTTAVLIAAAAVALRRSMGKAIQWAAAAVLVMLALQLTIGVTMVLRGFPLWLATAHNAGATLLLLATLALNRVLTPVRAVSSPGPAIRLF